MGLPFAAQAEGPASSAQDRLQLFWTGNSPSSQGQALKSWLFKDLPALKASSFQEKDPAGKMARWKGVALSQLIDQALASLTVEQRAQIDLIVVKNGEGNQAIIPRYLVNKFSLLLAFEKDGKSIVNQPEVVVPVTTQPRIQKEGLPLGTFAIKAPTRLELTSYSLRFSSLFLKRRTDPAAIRGEKMFVHNCIGCHATGHGRSLGAVSSGGTRSLASVGHPPGSGVPSLNERDLRALTSYFNAYIAETSTPPTGQGTAQPSSPSGPQSDLKSSSIRPEIFKKPATKQASR